MTHRSCYVSLLLAVLLTGCDSLRRQVSPKELTTEPERLVVNCYISPQDSVLAALLSHSQPILGTSAVASTDVSDAMVTLSDGIRSVGLRSVSQPGTAGSISTMYQIDARLFPIVAGRTYSLRVSVPDGRVVTASCTVPAAVSLTGVEIDSSAYVSGGQLFTDYYARLRWRDPAGQVNYYRIAGNNEYHYGILPSGSSASLPQQGRGSWYFNTSALLTDTDNDGKDMVSARAYLLTPSTWIDGQRIRSRPVGQLNAYLLTTDVHYYRFHEGLKRQEENDGNPFAEPVLIPSNIRGGLGCFGAYNRVTRTMTVR